MKETAICVICNDEYNTGKSIFSKAVCAHCAVDIWDKLLLIDNSLIAPLKEFIDNNDNNICEGVEPLTLDEAKAVIKLVPGQQLFIGTTPVRNIWGVHYTEIDALRKQKDPKYLSVKKQKSTYQVAVSNYYSSVQATIETNKLLQELRDKNATIINVNVKAITITYYQDGNNAFIQKGQREIFVVNGDEVPFVVTIVYKINL